MAPIVFQNILVPNPTGGPDILTSTLPAGVQSTFYTFAMTASGGTLPYVWSLASGTLDSGVTLSAGGIISGTPANAETDNITIRVTDAHGLFITKAFSLTFTPAVNPLTITTTSPLPTGTEFNTYTTTLVGTGGTPPYTWSIISGAFQTGLSLAPTTGVISGTPTQSGTDSVTIQLQDSIPNTTSKLFSLTITAPAPLTITTTSPLPGGTSGVFYSVTLNATGGVTPYKWSIVSGSLQTGLTLSSTGTISGTPSVASTATVTIQVQDNVNTTISKTFSLTTAPAASVTISISGNKFVNQNGATVTLKGANNSGLELCGPFGEHPWGGNPPNYALMAAWGFNCARFPLNSASFLGQTTWSVSGSNFGAQNNLGVGNGTQDPYGDYKAAIATVIQSCRANGIYPIFDLHWGSMLLTLGGVSHDVSYRGQLAFMDVNAETFWYDFTNGFVPWLGTNFGTAAYNANLGFNGGAVGALNNPAFGGLTGFGDIIFELFNEPFMGNAGETYSAGSADLTLLNGGTCNKFVTNGAGNITTTVGLAGYQNIVHGIRQLAASNIIIINGNEYTQNLQNYTTWAPTDPDTQIAFGWHPYCQAAWPYTSSPFTYPGIGNDSGAGTATSLTHAQAILNAGFPVIITEDGTDNGNNAGTFETITTNGGYDAHIDFMSAWAAPLNVGYIPWTFGGQDFYQAFNTTSAGNVLLRENATSTALLPIQGAGWSAYRYISGNGAPTTVNGSTLTPGIEGTSYSVTFTGQGGAGGPYTFAWVSDSGSGSTAASLNTTTGVMTWTLTSTVANYNIVIQVLDQYLVIGQYTYSLAVSASASIPTFVQLILQGNAKPGDNQGLGGDGHGPGTVSNPNQQVIGWKSVAGATTYNIYRSVTTTAGTNGAYSLYGSIAASSASSNYTTYVSSCTNSNGGSPFDPAPGIDSVFTDTAATTCVDANDTKGPTGGLYYGPTTGYTYKITSIISGVESSLSKESIAIFMANGTWIMCFGIFNNPPVITKSTAAPVTSPLGFNNATFMTLGHFPATQAYVNPYSGGGCVWGNLSVMGYNYYVVNVYPTAWVNGDMQQSTEIDGDLFIYNTITPTMNVTLNQWNTFKFPLSSYLNSNNGTGTTMAAVAQGIRQTSYYKTTWNNGASTNQNMSFYWESYFSVT